MKVLLFLTDRFPYGKGEAFIENEIEYIAHAFDKVYIMPVGLTVNVKEQRGLPVNITVLPPANTRDLYENGRPSKLQRVVWGLKNMVWWSIKTLFSSDFREEIRGLKKQAKLNVATFKAVIRTIAPVLRNEVHFKKELSKINLSGEDEIYIYSYWVNGLILKMDGILGSLYEKSNAVTKSGGIKLVFSRAHRHDLYDDARECGYIPLKDKVIDGIDRLYLISEDGIEYITEKNEKNKHKYRLSFLGTKDYLEGEGKQEYIERAEGEDKGRAEEKVLKIVSCSFVIPVKRIERIIESLSLVEGISIEWTHFGGGQDLEKMKKYGEEKLSCKNNIEYNFAGYINNVDLMKYYKNNRVDLFLNVSENEGIPVSIMEAMSFGIPIIATAVGGTKEAIAPGENGYLLDRDFDNNTLAKLIVEYGEKTREDKESFRLASRNLWEERFSAKNNYRDFVRDIFN